MTWGLMIAVSTPWPTQSSANDNDLGLLAIDEVLEHIERTGGRIDHAEILRLKGETLLMRDGCAAGRAEACFRNALEVARMQEAKWWELRTSVSLGRLLRDTGRRDEARPMLADIYNWFTEGFDIEDWAVCRGVRRAVSDGVVATRSEPYDVVTMKPSSAFASDAVMFSITSKLHARRLFALAAAVNGTDLTGDPGLAIPQGATLTPSMLCAQNEMVSGFRGRVITFTDLDYAADIEIQCSRIQSSDGPSGPFRVTSDTPSWHHPEGGLRIGNLPSNFFRTEITERIGCRPFGGTTAISTGVANFVLPGKRVVQAVSMYCPATQPRTTDQGLFPQCLYSTSAFQTGRVVRLRADALVQTISESYNCFAYAETFILGAVPERPLFGSIGLDSITITTKWLNQHGYSMVGAAPSIGPLAPANLGDLVMVENRLDKSVGSFQWYHVAVVTGVDSAGRITRLRQKPDAKRCVSDTTAAQFETVDPVSDGELYELWRNPSLKWSAMLGP